jgi:hypothetical protein
MVVHPKTGASYSCYQLNRTRKCDEYFKDYDYGGNWTGKYRKSKRTERIMIDNHRDRVVYLCNYILKNYYNQNWYALVGEYTQEKVSKRYDDELCVNDIKVIINGHRYNLS